MTQPLLSVSGLTVEFIHGDYAVRPFDRLSLRADAGELVVVLGPSGSGKTTLLSCLGGILTPASGDIRVGDISVTSLTGRDLELYRRSHVGFVFQAFNLIPSLSARENVAVPLMVAGRSRADSLGRADALLRRFGLEGEAGRRPSALSGGQQQRVAVARGVVHDPPLLLADEPTANLDYIQAEAVITLLRELREEGRVVVVSTHDARLVPIADQVFEMTAAAGTVEPPTTDVRYVPGESIFEQGDRADFVYTVVEGTVDIVRIHADGTEEVLARREAGQYFGELGPILGFPRSASARARTEVVLRAHGPDDFRRTVLRQV